MLDAIVILLDTLQTTGLSDSIQKKIHDKFDGPVLVIDQKSPYFPSVMNDHCTPIRRLIDHLIEVHHYKDIVFLNGREAHIHSIERLRGYKESMEAHGLPVLDENIYCGDIGIQAVIKWWNRCFWNAKNFRKQLPVPMTVWR